MVNPPALYKVQAPESIKALLPEHIRQVIALMPAGTYLGGSAALAYTRYVLGLADKVEIKNHDFFVFHPAFHHALPPQAGAEKRLFDRAYLGITKPEPKEWFPKSFLQTIGNGFFINWEPTTPDAFLFGNNVLIKFSEYSEDIFVKSEACFQAICANQLLTPDLQKVVDGAFHSNNQQLESFYRNELNFFLGFFAQQIKDGATYSEHDDKILSDILGNQAYHQILKTSFEEYMTEKAKHINAQCGNVIYLEKEKTEIDPHIQFMMVQRAYRFAKPKNEDFFPIEQSFYDVLPVDPVAENTDHDKQRKRAVKNVSQIIPKEKNKPVASHIITRKKHTQNIQNTQNKTSFSFSDALYLTVFRAKANAMLNAMESEQRLHKIQLFTASTPVIPQNALPKQYTDIEKQFRMLRQYVARLDKNPKNWIFNHTDLINFASYQLEVKYSYEALTKDSKKAVNIELQDLNQLIRNEFVLKLSQEMNKAHPDQDILYNLKQIIEPVSQVDYHITKAYLASLIAIAVVLFLYNTLINKNIETSAWIVGMFFCGVACLIGSQYRIAGDTLNEIRKRNNIVIYEHCVAESLKSLLTSDRIDLKRKFNLISIILLSLQELKSNGANINHSLEINIRSCSDEKLARALNNNAQLIQFFLQFSQLVNESPLPFLLRMRKLALPHEDMQEKRIHIFMETYLCLAAIYGKNMIDKMYENNVPEINIPLMNVDEQIALMKTKIESLKTLMKNESLSEDEQLKAAQLMNDIALIYVLRKPTDSDYFTAFQKENESFTNYIDADLKDFHQKTEKLNHTEWMGIHQYPKKSCYFTCFLKESPVQALNALTHLGEYSGMTARLCKHDH